MTAPEHQRFDRLPASDDVRDDPEQATRAAVLDWWESRFGIPPSTFDGYTFWEKGAGKVWVLHGEVQSPYPIEVLGLHCLRTRQEHWKPTTNAVQRFGQAATRNRIHLDLELAKAFLEGRDVEIEWDGDWGYLIATADIADRVVALGVGLYTYGELKSQIPKGRRVAIE